MFLRTQYKACVEAWRLQTRERDKQTEMRVIESNNLGTFYKYVNMRISYRSGIGALTDNFGDVITDDVRKANMFNDYFESVGTVDNDILRMSCHVVVSVDKLFNTVECNAGHE